MAIQDHGPGNATWPFTLTQNTTTYWLKSLISCFSHGFFTFIGSYMYITL